MRKTTDVKMVGSNEQLPNIPLVLLILSLFEFSVNTLRTYAC